VARILPPKRESRPSENSASKSRVKTRQAHLSCLSRLTLEPTSPAKRHKLRGQRPGNSKGEMRRPLLTCSGCQLQRPTCKPLRLKIACLECEMRWPPLTPFIRVSFSTPTAPPLGAKGDAAHCRLCSSASWLAVSREPGKIKKMVWTCQKSPRFPRPAVSREPGKIKKNSSPHHAVASRPPASQGTCSWANSCCASALLRFWPRKSIVAQIITATSVPMMPRTTA